MNICKNSNMARLFIVFFCISVFIVCFLLISKVNSLVLNISPTDHSKHEQPFKVLFQLTGNKSTTNNQVFTGTNWLYLIKSINAFDYKGNLSITINVDKTINIQHLQKIITGIPKPLRVFIINDGAIDKTSVGGILTIYYSAILASSIILLFGFCYWFFHFFATIVTKYTLQFKVKKEQKQSYYLWIGLFLLCTSLFLLSFNYLAYTDFKAAFYNSDELFFPAIMNDLWHDGSIFKWNLSLSTFIFPDYLLFCLAYLITKNTYLMFLTFFNIQLILLFWLVVMLFSVFVGKRKSIYFAGWVSFLLAILAILPFNETSVYRIQVFSGFHFGAFLVVLMLLNFLIRGFHHNTFQRYYSIACILIISILGTLSDIFVVIWFIVPTIMTLLLLYILGGKKLKLVNAYMLTSIIGALFGLILLKYFHVNSRGGAHFIQFTSGAILKQIFFAGFFIKDFLVLTTIFSLFWIAIAIATATLFKKQKSLPPLKLAFIFYLTSSAIIFFVELLAQNLGFADRYMLPNFILPIIIIVPFLCNTLKGYHLFALLVFSLAIPANKIKYAQISLNEYYPEEVKCIDQTLLPYKVHNGIAQYWEARFYTLLSKNNLKLYSVDGSTLKQFEALSPITIPTSYDFAIININPGDRLPAYLLNENLIYNINGKPLNKLTNCKNYIILIYTQGGLKIN